MAKKKKQATEVAPKEAVLSEEIVNIEVLDEVKPRIGGYTDGNTRSSTPNPQCIGVPNNYEGGLNISSFTDQRFWFAPVFGIQGAEPTEDDIHYPIGAIVRYPEDNPTKCKIMCGIVGKKARWADVTVGAGGTATILANIKMQNADGSSFNVVPLGGELIFNFDDTLVAEATGVNGNSFKLNNLATTRIRLNSNLAEEVAYTNLESYLNFNVTGGGATLNKINDNTMELEITGGGGGSDPNAIHEIVTNNGTGTPIGNVLVLSSILNEGLAVSGSTGQVTINVLPNRYIPRAYTVGETYARGELVFSSAGTFITLVTNIATSGLPTQPNFYPIVGVVNSVQTNSGIPVYPSITGTISHLSGSPTTLNISTVPSGLSYNVTAVQTLLDSSGNPVIRNQKLQDLADPMSQQEARLYS